MELRGDRVVLRPLAEADVDRIVELGSDPEADGVWRDGLLLDMLATELTST
jgi:hypothetical protein